MPMPEVDWNEVWKSIQNCEKHHELRGKQFWDGRAKEFTRAVTKTDYVNQFIDILKPEPDWSVLDIGSAAGTLAVPLARRCRAITAVEPSGQMRSLLQERCVSEGLDNITIVEGSWQDDWRALGLEPHDVAIASRSLVVKDLRAAIETISRFARKRVVLSALVDDGPHDSAILRAAGRPAHGGADFIVVYNLLRQMGIYANLCFTHNCTLKHWPTVEDALHDMRWMFHGMNEAEEDRLRVHLAATLVPGAHGLRLPYRRVVRWAVMWWDKDPCPKEDMA